MSRTTTGIKLREYFRDGRYELTQPGKPTTIGDRDDPLDSMRIRACLEVGYWLRAGEFGGRGGHRLWTWMQL